jgi:hypothetical protein
VIAQGLADDLFGQAVAISRGGVDQGHAGIEGGVDGGDGIRLRLGSPEFVTGQRPGAEGEG